MKRRFFTWVDEALSAQLPPSIQAFNFNLYEGHKRKEWHVQIGGAKSFSVEDDDWACDEVFTTGENIFVVKSKDAGKEWEEALKCFLALAKAYLEEGQHAALLKSKRGVGMGFVDGDLHLLYVSENAAGHGKS